MLVKIRNPKEQEMTSDQIDNQFVVQRRVTFEHFTSYIKDSVGCSDKGKPYFVTFFGHYIYLRKDFMVISQAYRSLWIPNNLAL